MAHMNSTQFILQSPAIAALASRDAEDPPEWLVHLVRLPIAVWTRHLPPLKFMRFSQPSSWVLAGLFESNIEERLAPRVLFSCESAPGILRPLATGGSQENSRSSHRLSSDRAWLD